MQSIIGTSDRLKPGEQFLWFRHVGYVRVRALIRGGILVYVFLTSLITILTSDLVTLVFLGAIAVVIIQFVSIDRYVSPRRKVTVYTDGDFFIAEHVGTGAVRHGETPEDALNHLNSLIEDPQGAYEHPQRGGRTD